MNAITYYRTADLPALKLWIFDDDGSLINFATGWTFVLKIGDPGSAALLTKGPSGIAGAAGSGVEPTGVPNVVVTWSAGEINLTAGTYGLQLTATSGGLDRVFAAPFVILDVIT